MVCDLLGRRDCKGCASFFTASRMEFDNIPSGLPLVRECKLRALGITILRRSAAAPAILTLAEAGFPGFEAVSWFAMSALANTPKTIASKLQLESAKILKSPDPTRRRLGTDRLDSARFCGVSEQ